MNMRKVSFLFAIAVLSLCSACRNGRETTYTTTAIVAHEDSATIFAEREDGAVVAENSANMRFNDVNIESETI